MPDRAAATVLATRRSAEGPDRPWGEGRSGFPSRATIRSHVQTRQHGDDSPGAGLQEARARPASVAVQDDSGHHGSSSNDESKAESLLS